MGNSRSEYSMRMNSKFAVLLAGLMAASAWFYVQRVLIAHQKTDAALHSRPRGTLSDLYPRWLGTRELLLHRRDPYSAEITREIQTGYYGRPLQPENPNDPRDEQRFAYPIYVVFLLAPAIIMPFPMVQQAFLWSLALATAISVLFWLRVLRWQPGRTTVAILVILTLGSFATVQGMKLQQLSLLVAALIAVAAFLLTRGHLFLAGVLLAVSTIKPQLAVLPAGWLLLWTLTRWRERRNLLFGFISTGVVLAAAGEYLLPGWIGEFVEGLSAYNRYTGGQSLLDVLTTPKVGLALAILTVSGTAALCWRLRDAPAGTADFNLCFALALAVTIVVAPMVAIYNQVLLLPALFLIVRSWCSLWSRDAMTRIFCRTAVLIFFWPWFASSGLALASIFLSSATVQKGWSIPLWTSLYIPLAVLGLLAIYSRDAWKRPRSV